ncbi:hypothetical protein SAMN06893096_103340 [Geodermatophilus pulveris]|uniref:Zinc-ribbon domain-containing protein n=1 Tax=Geodermatophilus pulveris TaxID=1564159 RepID=A0A239DTY3_9ACTN|nr:zinc ribbon domain-containing protein [Geodermatophilus pulveris]SNS35193.1 hypothetical protein SAMN06893096_103340 [Geodermatophilus pulveris]
MERRCGTLPRPSPARRAGATALLALALLAPVAPGTAHGAEEPPAAAEGVRSGVEGSKAALVRIEVWANAEIAHIDHTTGEVNVVRGRYEVPIRTATGVFTSSEGVIATTGQALAVTEDDVVVHAANRLFQEEMGTALLGNDGDLSRRAEAADAYWDPHLNHCYDQVEHCVLFFVPRFTVFPYTQDAAGTPADPLPLPGGPADVGLLRIGGGGGTPTAELAPPGQPVPAEALLAGFTGTPAPDRPPAEVPVAVDAAAGVLTSSDELSPALTAGMAGAPVLDPATGQVTGLATTAAGVAALVPAQALHEALQVAGTPPAGSEFDAVFRRGIDHLGAGRSSGAAVSSLREALTYYDSALAARYLQQAEQGGGGGTPAAATDGDDGGGLPGGLGVWVTAAVLALLAVGLAVLARRRRAGPGGDDGPPAAPATGPGPGRDATTVAPRGGPAAGPPAEAPAPQPRPVPGRAAPDASAERTRLREPLPEDPRAERTRLRQPPALVEDVPRRAAAFCADCGTPLRERARFCGACGSAVG